VRYDPDNPHDIELATDSNMVVSVVFSFLFLVVIGFLIYAQNGSRGVVSTHGKTS